MASFWKWLLGWELGEVVRSDWRIRFVAEYSNYVKLGLVLVLAALAYLTIRCYRREGEAPRRAKATLAAIRIAVLLLVMAIVLQPAVVLRYVRNLTSSVVVLWDDSQSMGFKDGYSDPNAAELKARLMRDLGVDAAGLSQMTRTEIAGRTLLQPLERLSIDHPLIFVRFAIADRPGSGGAYTREIGIIDLVQPDGAGRSDPNAAGEIRTMLSRLAARGYYSNQPAAIYGGLEGTQGQRVAAIVVVSDGMMTTGGSGSAISGARENAASRGVQVYTVMAGDPTPPKHIAVTALQAPREARCGAEVEFTVNLAHRNMGGQNLTVKLHRRRLMEDANAPWGEPIASQAVTLERSSSDPNLASRDLQAVVIRTKPGGTSADSNLVGDFEYRAIIEPLPEGERAADAFAVAPVRIVEEKIRVLLISGDAGKEFQYLRNYIRRTDDDYLVSVWQQNADANVNQAASSGMKLETLPKELDELIGVPGNKDKPGYNVVILYDPQKTEGGFDRHFVEDMLKPFVQKHHGGLCYIAGNKHSGQVLGTDPAFAALREMMAVTLAPDMLDIARLGESKTEAWQLRLTSYGLDHPVTRLGHSAEDSPDIWADLPGIYWSHPVAKPKPGARVLAVSSDPLKRLASRNEPLPVIAVQPFGKGSVLYIGFDESWRWMMVRDGLYHRNFWSNVVRYLASLQARRVTITTGGSRFTLGEDITLEAEVYDESYQPSRSPFVEVEMVDSAGDVQRKLKLSPVEDRPGQFKTDFKADRTGKFQLVAKVESVDPNEPPASKHIEIEMPQGEFLRTEADRDTLRSLSWPPDKSMDLTDADRLSEIPSGRWTSTHEVPKYLWDTNLMLAAIVVLLAVEWILRKKYNMA